MSLNHILNPINLINIPTYLATLKSVSLYLSFFQKKLINNLYFRNKYINKICYIIEIIFVHQLVMIR